MKFYSVIGFAAIILFIYFLGGCSVKELVTLPYDNKGSNLYSNPSDVNNIGDPFVLKASDGFYYMYCTSSDIGYFCWKSADLVNWTDKKFAFKRNKDSWAMTCFWAPEVVEQNNVYYMYYTGKNKEGSLKIGVAISSSPDGPFEEALEGPLFDFGYAAIDANVFIDDDSTKYLYYSRDCSENIQDGIRKSEIYGVRLGDDMISVSGEPVHLTTPTQIWETGSSDIVWNEGPEMIKHEGSYYLTYSANFFASPSYSVGYAVSDAPLGTFTKSESNPILTSGSYENISGTGHHSFTTSPDGKELYMVYHSHTDPAAPSGNRQVNIDRVIFTDSGEMYVNGPTISFQPMPSDTSLTNIALHQEVKNTSGASVPLLTDGIFTIHKKNEDFDWVSELGDDGNVKVTIEWEEAKTISTILVYRGVDPSSDFTGYDVTIDDSYQIKDCSLAAELDQRAAIASFEPVTAKKLIFTLHPKTDAKKISLSEIMVLGN
ncbi:MAG: hypothetical protein K0S47_87 [Herbinix sp.]|nr:hypothetical protein [Herbinix sp.]